MDSQEKYSTNIPSTKMTTLLLQTLEHENHYIALIFLVLRHTGLEIQGQLNHTDYQNIILYTRV